MFEKLRVKDEELFAQLSAVCADLSRSARLLEFLLSGARADEDDLVARIRATDDDAHRIARAVDAQTFKAFLLRLDRMELHELATSLDRAVASIDEAAAQAHAVHASDAPAPLRTLAARVTGIAVALEAAMPHVGRGTEPIEALTARVQQHRMEGDEAFYAGVELLFATDADAVDMLRWRDIYEKVHHALGEVASVAAALDRMSFTHH